MAVKPRFTATAKGMKPRNNAAARAAISQQYQAQGMTISKGNLNRLARRKSMGGSGG